MELRHKIGLYLSYFLSMAGLGFILPFLPLYLGERGISDQSLGIIWTLGALTSLLQLHCGVIADRTGWRRPMLLASLGIIAISGLAISFISNFWLLVFLVILFSENGLVRGLVESLSGAEATALAPEGKEARALSALRFWRPAGILVVTVICGWLLAKLGIETAFLLVVCLQFLSFFTALLMIGAKVEKVTSIKLGAINEKTTPVLSNLMRDPILCTFITAMILFHFAGAPAGLYFSLFVSRELMAPESFIALTFIVDMAAWLIVVFPTGWLADRYGWKPLLIMAWLLLAVRNGMLSVATEHWQLIVLKIFDGIANGMFAVLAASWVVKWLGDRNRSAEAHAIVGVSLVLGSALGTLASGLSVEWLGYRDLFAALAIAALIAAIFLLKVPEIRDAKVSK